MESSRREKLDNAFLFMLSFVGLLFTIIQVYIEGISGLIEISPLLFLGVFLPFYVGYLKGAVEFDSIIERIRGWVYMSVGISTYLAFFLMSIDPNLYWLFIFFAFLSTYFLKNWFNSIFQIEDDISNLYAYFGTIISGYSLATVSRLSINLLIVGLPHQIPLFSLLVEVLFIYGGLILTIALEKLSKEVVGIQPPVEQKQIEKQKRMYSSFRGFFMGLYIFGFRLVVIPLMVNMKTAFFWFQTYAFALIGLITGLRRVPIFAEVFLITSLVFATFGLYFFLTMEKIDFSKMQAHVLLPS